MRASAADLSCFSSTPGSSSLRPTAATPYHAACTQLLETDPGPLVTSPMVIAEAAYLIDRELGPVAEQALYATIIDDTLLVESLGHADWVRLRELVGRYRDLPLGGTDASLVALAERLDTSRVATLDRRHFTVVRPSHVGALTLLPQSGVLSLG